MLATNPVDPDYTFHFLSLQSLGDHSHVQRTDEGGLGDAVTVLGAAALLVVGYVIGGAATSSSTVASAGDAPQPVDIGGGVAKVKPATGNPATFAPAGPVVGEFRLGPGNQQPVGIVRITVPGPAVGEFRLAPGNQQPVGVVRTSIPAPAVGEFRLAPGNQQPVGIVRALPAPAAGEFRLAPGNQQPVGIAVR